MLTAIATILSMVFKGVTQGIDGWVKNKQAQRDTSLAMEQARKELAELRIRAELERGVEQLRSTGRYFKYVTFFLWAGPFLFSYVPGLSHYSVLMFENLEKLPIWYSQSMVVLIFAVWGISVSAPAIKEIFFGIGSYLREKQQLKYSIDKKAYYAELKNQLGPLGQKFVDANEKALDVASPKRKE